MLREVTPDRVASGAAATEHTPETVRPVLLTHAPRAATSPRVLLAGTESWLLGLGAGVRRGLPERGGRVCAEAGRADEVVALAVEYRPDVAVIDVGLPGSGLRATQDLTRALPQVPIVTVAATENEEELFDALRAGASGYLPSAATSDDVVDAVREVLAGRPVLAPELMLRVLEEFRAPTRARLARGSALARRLSAREWEVMELLGQGLSTDQVADRLFLSPTTVRVHVSGVVRKLRARDRADALLLLSRPR